MGSGRKQIKLNQICWAPRSKLTSPPLCLKCCWFGKKLLVLLLSFAWDSQQKCCLKVFERGSVVSFLHQIHQQILLVGKSVLKRKTSVVLQSNLSKATRYKLYKQSWQTGLNVPLQACPYCWQMSTNVDKLRASAMNLLVAQTLTAATHAYATRDTLATDSRAQVSLTVLPNQHSTSHYI